MNISFLTVMFAVAIPAIGQESGAVVRTVNAKQWVQRRLPNGQPDLQGTWTNGSSIPMERPKELGAKEFYTQAEKDEVAKNDPHGFRGDRKLLPEAHYDPTQFGLDLGQGNSLSMRTSVIVGLEGRIPAQTPEAQKRNAQRVAWTKEHEFDGPEDRPLPERCIVLAQEGPPMISAVYNNNLEIVQGPGYVAILNEMIHDVRMIPLNGGPHIPQNIRQWRGDPRGHWEGNTLVVDTTNFTDKTAFRGSTASLHVTERFTRTEENLIVYDFTVEDPATWVKPWSGQLLLGRASGQIFEYACHEGNYGLANTLSAARAEEKRAAIEAVKETSHLKDDK